MESKQNLTSIPQYFLKCGINDVVKVHLCAFCDYVALNAENLQHHNKKCSKKLTEDEQKFACKMCNFSTLYRRNLKTHELTHQSESVKNLEKKFVCNICDYKTCRKGDFDKHYERHKPKSERSFPCPLCKFASNSLSQLFNHKKKTHENEKIRKYHVCKICNYKTEFPKNLRIHLNLHGLNDITDTKKSLSCNVCDFKTFYKRNFKIHLETHNPEKKFICSTCNFASASEFLLKKHEKIHNKVHNCNKCAFKTAYQSHLKKHLELHEPKNVIELKKKHFCNSCNFKTRHIGNLKTHQRTHEADPVKNIRKRHSCKDCDYKTERLSDLKKHYKSHKPKVKKSKKSLKTVEKINDIYPNKNLEICGQATIKVDTSNLIKQEETFEILETDVNNSVYGFPIKKERNIETDGYNLFGNM